MADDAGTEGAGLRAELDSIAQNLYGGIAALDGHRRRAHRAGGRSAQELEWAVRELSDMQRRLGEAAKELEP